MIEKLRIYKESGAMAGDALKLRPARLLSRDGNRVSFSVKGYSYTLGARAGNSAGYRQTGYAKAQRFTATVLSEDTPRHGAFLDLKLSNVESVEG